MSVSQSIAARRFLAALAASAVVAVGLRAVRADPPIAGEVTTPMTSNASATPLATTEIATLGAGCFWCVEAVFAELDGVLSVESGYSGGRTADPTYEDVCTGRTGHAEVCQIRYDPARLRFEDLLEVFWKTHDPTTPDRQGSDVGSQYRSVVFFHSDRQRQLAEEYRKKLDASGAFSAPVVTAVEPFRGFYRAEDYHQDYFRLNGERPYCRLVIGPKVEKFREVFRGKLKSP